MEEWGKGWWIVGAILVALTVLAFVLAFLSEGNGAFLGAIETRPSGPSAETPIQTQPAAPPPRPETPMHAAPPETPVQTQQEEPLEWSRPRFGERADRRNRMVQQQIELRDIEDESVLDAMRHVPRHLFVPERWRTSAYTDQPLPIEHGQTISQPYIVAYMTDLLELEPGDRVLEVGTGSGYQAAVLSEITPYVYTIEIIEPLAQEAADRLEELGYETIEVKHADGYYGWPEHAPFDGIIVTAAAGHVPPPLKEQLKPGGRMVIPVGGVFEVQRLILLRKDEEGQIHTRSLMPVRFVPMTGRAQREG
jgi:protein-L-isoaspartate(D-aspartate) O-methyltransferase